MAITFPAWWPQAVRDQVVDIEEVMCELFRPLLGGVEPVNWLPTDEQTQQVLFEDQEAFLRVYRLGGEVDLENNLDIHRVQLAAISNDGEQSVEILAFAQWTLYAYERTGYVTMPDGAKVALTFRDEILGPILDPQQIRDARLVRATFEVETPWPKGLHRRVLENLDRG